MPIYEYLCKECGNRFEVIQKFNDSPIDRCIKCGGKVKKLISNSTFILKGSGWYLTDYARKGKEQTTNKKKNVNKDNNKESAEKPKE
jgi:putative FmdB family regulatory protein